MKLNGLLLLLKKVLMKHMYMSSLWNTITRVLYGHTKKIGVGFQKEMLFVPHGHGAGSYQIFLYELKE